MADKTFKADNFVSGYIDTTVISTIDTATGNEIGISFSVDQVWPKNIEDQTSESTFEVVRSVLASFTMSRKQAADLANLLLKAIENDG
ncbi:MAG: hypothetical protein WManBPW_08080 [Shewanella algae]|uniref:hypothetical protein n=1 Tax=Shewanella algae TaxID=38313 RepID=UPI001AAF7CE6|nr:hypothetical protein [Shewanella algae]MBO2578160.1 hypothetical protein [Shewanella algae]